MTYLRNTRKNAAGTVNRILALLSVVFQEAVSRTFAVDNPVRGVKRQREQIKPVPFLENTDIDKIIAACSTDLRPLVRLAVETGLRRGELVGLDWPDVDFSRGEHGVLTVKVSKSGKARQVPLTSRARATLDALFAARAPTPLQGRHPVFPDFQGWRIDRITRGVASAASRAGFQNVTMHSMRHQFGSHLARAGVEIPMIARLLGHSPNSIQVTLRYSAHAPAGAEFQAIQALEARDARGAYSPSARDRQTA